jgi:hypothetical protein
VNPFKLLSFLILVTCFLSCNTEIEIPKGNEQQYELKLNPNDKYLSLIIDHGPTNNLNFTDSQGNKYRYATMTTVITNDTTLPIEVKINFSKENTYRDPAQKLKAFIIPETLTPAEELKKRFDIPINGTVTLNPTDSYFSSELKEFLEAKKDISTIFIKIIGPKEKCTINIGVLGDEKFDPPIQMAVVSKGHKYPFIDDKLFTLHEWHLDEAISSSDPLNLFLGFDFFRMASPEQYKGYSLIPCGQISFINK